MGLTASAKTETHFEPIPEGTHQMVCYGVLDEGTHHNERYNNDSYKTYTIRLESLGQVVNVDYFMTNLLDELVEINDSTIKWVETTNPATGNVMGFYYKNGAIAMSNALQAAISSCNHLDCPTSYYGTFEVFKDDCYKANVGVVYYRR